MNKINKNRLIGGSVIAFAALLFAPAILTPQENTLINPNLAVTINPSAGSNSQSVSSTQQPSTSPPVVVIPAPPSLTLESTTEIETAKNNVSAPKAPNNNVAVALTQKTPQKNTSTAQSSWLRVGSFASTKNANSLLKKLQSRYSAKVEKITVNGKTYHRVLIGPYTNEQTLQKAKQALAKSGYSPNIQR